MQPRTSEFSAMSAAVTTAWYHSGKSSARLGSIAFCGAFCLGGFGLFSAINLGGGFATEEDFLGHADNHRQHGDDGDAQDDIVKIFLRRFTEVVAGEDDEADPGDHCRNI